jgi:hypothetical protein
MSDWSSYEGDKEIADKWRQFLTEDKQLDEGVLDTVKAKASAARTKAAAATGAAKKGIGKVTGTKAAAARNIKARKVSDWLHGKPQKMRTMNTKFGTGTAGAAATPTNSSITRGAVDPDFDPGTPKYLSAEQKKLFAQTMKDIEMGQDFITRIFQAGADEVPVENGAKRKLDKDERAYAKSVLQKINAWAENCLKCNGYTDAEPPAEQAAIAEFQTKNLRGKKAQKDANREANTEQQAGNAGKRGCKNYPPGELPVTQFIENLSKMVGPTTAENIGKHIALRMQKIAPELAIT